MKNYGDIDSKFRYVIIAALRAKDLLKGAKPKIKTRSKNLIRVAQHEVQEGLIDYELITLPDEEIREVEDDMFIGEEIEESDREPEVVDVEEEKGKKTQIEIIESLKTIGPNLIKNWPDFEKKVKTALKKFNLKPNFIKNIIRKIFNFIS